MYPNNFVVGVYELEDMQEFFVAVVNHEDDLPDQDTIKWKGVQTYPRYYVNWPNAFIVACDYIARYDIPSSKVFFIEASLENGYTQWRKVRGGASWREV